ncbi:MAG: RodZ domain-containing protein [Lysobacterales bacterium]
MKQQQELIPMATGEYLKKLRMERKLSLADVAKAVILDEKLLRNIEQDTAGHIALLYRNGYIQTYARFLEVAEEDIPALLIPAEVKEAELHNIFAKPPKRNSTEKWLRSSSYVLASLLVGTLAWQFTHEAVRLSQNGSRLKNNGATTAESRDVSNPAQQRELSGPVSASIAPLGALHAKRKGEMDTAEQAWAALSEQVLPDGESRLQVIVSADSWVEIIDASGQELEMDLLRGGSDKAYHGEPPFRILLGRASAVRLSMDGEAVDLTAFTRDDVAQLSWPQKLQIETSEPDSN